MRWARGSFYRTQWQSQMLAAATTMTAPLPELSFMSSFI